jgi:hypothetical protein
LCPKSQQSLSQSTLQQQIKKAEADLVRLKRQL